MIPNKNKVEHIVSSKPCGLEMSVLNLAAPHLKWLGSGAGDAVYPDSRRRKRTPTSPQPSGGGTKGVCSLLLESDKPCWRRVGRCLIFFAIKLGSCLSGYVESCDILGFVRPA